MTAETGLRFIAFNSRIFRSLKMIDLLTVAEQYPWDTAAPIVDSRVVKQTKNEMMAAALGNGPISDKDAELLGSS